MYKRQFPFSAPGARLGEPLRARWALLLLEDLMLGVEHMLGRATMVSGWLGTITDEVLSYARRGVAQELEADFRRAPGDAALRRLGSRFLDATLDALEELGEARGHAAVAGAMRALGRVERLAADGAGLAGCLLYTSDAADE